MMRVFHTKDGKKLRELTKAEVETLAALGDNEAKVYLAKSEFSKARTLEEKINAIAKAVGIL